MYPESIITKADQEIVTARVESEADYKNQLQKTVVNMSGL